MRKGAFGGGRAWRRGDRRGRGDDARDRGPRDVGRFVALYGSGDASGRRFPESLMRRPRPTKSRVDEHGTTTLWVLGLCISLLFLGGLSLDLWRAVADRRQ